MWPPYVQGVAATTNDTDGASALPQPAAEEILYGSLALGAETDEAALWARTHPRQFCDLVRRRFGNELGNQLVAEAEAANRDCPGYYSSEAWVARRTDQEASPAKAKPPHDPEIVVAWECIAINELGMPIAHRAGYMGVEELIERGLHTAAYDLQQGLDE